MHALNGLGALAESTLLFGLEDNDPRVRIQAIRLAEQFVEDSGELRSVLIAMAAGTEQPLRVRYQLAFSLGSAGASHHRNQALAKLAIRDGENSWMQLAIQSSLANGAEEVLQVLLEDETFRRTAHGKTFLTSLVSQISGADRAVEIAAVIGGLNALPNADRELSESLIRALVGSRQGQERQVLMAAASGRASELVDQLLVSARELLDRPGDREQQLEERIQAVSTLGLGGYTDDAERFRALFDLSEPPQIQLAAVDTLARFETPDIAKLLIDAWPSLSPAVRSRAAETLCLRASWLSMFLDAVSSEKHRARRRLADSRHAAEAASRPGDSREGLGGVLFRDGQPSPRRCGFVSARSPATR